MKFNTKDVIVPGTGVSKAISYGILKLKLMDIVLTPSANGSGNTKLQFLVEDDNPVEEGYEYEGVLFGKRTAKNKSGRIQYEVPFKLEEDNTKINSLLATFADLANKTNCREEFDALGDKDYQKFEDYLKDAVKVLSNKYAYFVVKAEEYLGKENKVGLNRSFKAWKRDAGLIIFSADSTVTVDKNIHKIVSPEGRDYTWDKSNAYDYKPIATPDADPNTGITTAPTNAINDSLPF